MSNLNEFPDAFVVGDPAGVDPDALTAMVDDQRKAAKENGLHGIENAFTGELMDPDDLPALKAALQEIEDYLRQRRMGSVYATRDRLAKRIAKLSPALAMPSILAQTETQKRVTRCPHCRTILPSSTPDPKADDSPEKGATASSPSVSEAGAAPELPSGVDQPAPAHAAASAGAVTDAPHPGAAGAPNAGEGDADGAAPSPLPQPDPEDLA